MQSLSINTFQDEGVFVVTSQKFNNMTSVVSEIVYVVIFFLKKNSHSFPKIKDFRTRPPTVSGRTGAEVIEEDFKADSNKASRRGSILTSLLQKFHMMRAIFRPVSFSHAQEVKRMSVLKCEFASMVAVTFKEAPQLFHQPQKGWGGEGLRKRGKGGNH